MDFQQRTDTQAVSDSERPVTKDFAGHGVTNIVGCTHEVSMFFKRTGWKCCVINFVANGGFPPMESKEGADVLSAAFGTLKRNATKRPVMRQVQKERNMHEAWKPSASWRSRAIQECVRHGLQSLVMSSARILMLLMRFALPLSNVQSPQNTNNTGTFVSTCARSLRRRDMASRS